MSKTTPNGIGTKRERRRPTSTKDTERRVGKDIQGISGTVYCRKKNQKGQKQSRSLTANTGDSGNKDADRAKAELEVFFFF